MSAGKATTQTDRDANSPSATSRLQVVRGMILGGASQDVEGTDARRAFLSSPSPQEDLPPKRRSSCPFVKRRNGYMEHTFERVELDFSIFSSLEFEAACAAACSRIVFASQIHRYCIA